MTKNIKIVLLIVRRYRYDFAGLKRRAGAFTPWPGAYSENVFRTCLPPGAMQKKANTTHLTHAATAQQQLLVVSQPSSTDKAPSTDRSTDDRSKLLGELAPS